MKRIAVILIILGMMFLGCNKFNVGDSGSLICYSIEPFVKSEKVWDSKNSKIIESDYGSFTVCDLDTYECDFFVSGLVECRFIKILDDYEKENQ